jgi:hypothetical protein
MNKTKKGKINGKIYCVGENKSKKCLKKRNSKVKLKHGGAWRTLFSSMTSTPQIGSTQSRPLRVIGIDNLIEVKKGPLDIDTHSNGSKKHLLQINNKFYYCINSTVDDRKLNITLNNKRFSLEVEDRECLRNRIPCNYYINIGNNHIPIYIDVTIYIIDGIYYYNILGNEQKLNPISRESVSLNRLPPVVETITHPPVVETIEKTVETLIKQDEIKEIQKIEKIVKNINIYQLHTESFVSTAEVQKLQSELESLEKKDIDIEEKTLIRIGNKIYLIQDNQIGVNEVTLNHVIYKIIDDVMYQSDEKYDKKYITLNKIKCYIYLKTPIRKINDLYYYDNIL